MTLSPTSMSTTIFLVTSKIAYRVCCNDTGEILSSESFQDMFMGVYPRPEDYAYELAESCGHDIDGAKWPFSCIDWEHAWRELSYDRLLR